MTSLLLGVIAIAFFVLTLCNIRWAVFVVAALLPTYLVRFSIGPFPSTLLEILLVITILVWGIKYRGFQMANPRLFSWRWPILLLLLAGIIGVIVAPDTRAALGVFRAYLIEPILFFFVAASALRDRRDVEKLFGAFACSALMVSTYAIIQRLTGIGIPTPWNTESRVTSFYPYPNALGLFLAPLIPLFIARGAETAISYFHDRANMRQLTKSINKINGFIKSPAGGLMKQPLFALLWFGAAGLSLIAIIFAKTEAAIVALVATGILIAFYYKKTRWVAAVVLVVMVFGFFATGRDHPITQKLLLRDWSGIVRQTQWSETFTMLRDYPIFGAGLAGYPITLGPYHKAFYFEIFQYPHNIILNFWTELGLLGLAAFIWIIARFFTLIRKILSSLFSVLGSNILPLGIAAAMFTLLIHGLVDVPYFKNDLAVQFWLLIATATVLASPKEKSMIK